MRATSSTIAKATSNYEIATMCPTMGQPTNNSFGYLIENSTLSCARCPPRVAAGGRRAAPVAARLKMGTCVAFSRNRRNAWTVGDLHALHTGICSFLIRHRDGRKRKSLTDPGIGSGIMVALSKRMSSWLRHLARVWCRHELVFTRTTTRWRLACLHCGAVTPGITMPHRENQARVDHRS